MRIGCGTLLATLLLGLALPLAARQRDDPEPVQRIVQRPGFVEPHTPGAGDPLELAPGPTLAALLGSAPELNRVTTIRTSLPRGGEVASGGRGRPRGPRPRAVLILVPGFLGGAATFDPLARDLVRELGGELEVWAVDRRSNQLEDRRGARQARRRLERAARAGDLEAQRAALADGVRFYFPADLDADGAPDPPLELPDASGSLSSFLRLAQDDVRFAAHWGADTYVRDWKQLVEEARRRVGPHGLVLFGGHSLGTSWAGVFAAYDFDPGPGVRAGHELVDGLVLLEGGGPGAPSATAPGRDAYLAAVADLERSGGPPVYLESLFGFIDPVDLGTAGDLSGLAGAFLPDDPSLLQRTDLFGAPPVSLLLMAPMTNQALLGFFLDDDFSTSAAFSASMGFSDNAPNVENPFDVILPGDFYIASPLFPDVLRTWKNAGDPTLPTCPPNDPSPTPRDRTVGCAIRDNGPRPAPSEPRRVWGLEREVTDVRVLLRSLYETTNASEWYFVSGRTFLDLSFGRDSSALGLPELLNVTQNAAVEVPILAIGASNGLATTEEAFAGYLASVATPPRDRTIVILEGYSHVDVVSASDNEAVPVLAGWIRRLQEERRPGRGPGHGPHGPKRRR
jgi:pimeloyl-ACP methyl ester carboxylesterase